MAKTLDELNPNQLLAHGERYFVFFYTPLCGTCKLARRMLDVVEATVPDMLLYTCDANFAGQIIEAWQVRSVPALAYVADGVLHRIQFAFSGVAELFQNVQSFLKDEPTD